MLNVFIKVWQNMEVFFFFFFLVQCVVNLMGLALLKKMSKRRENHGTKVKVIEGLYFIQLIQETMIKFDKYNQFQLFQHGFFCLFIFYFLLFFNLRKRNEKQKLLCDICLMFTLKFGRTFILKKKKSFFFFLGGCNRS